MPQVMDLLDARDLLRDLVCPACGSERIEHHEDIVARRHFRRVRADGVLVFDGFTDSFDDDGMRPRLWCGGCSQEWHLPEQGVEFE